MAPQALPLRILVEDLLSTLPKRADPGCLSVQKQAMEVVWSSEMQLVEKAGSFVQLGDATPSGEVRLQGPSQSGSQRLALGVGAS